MWPFHLSAVTPNTSWMIPSHSSTFWFLGVFSFVERDDRGISPQDLVCGLRVDTPGYDKYQTEVAILLQGCHWSSAPLGAGGRREKPQGVLLRKEGHN